jgi:uncharacterized protein YdeI (YjbR/CyaY-like superfamily)
MPPTFFATPADFSAWLEAHHAQASELLVGFFKKETGRPSITWPESVDLALCFGWIDGIRKRIDDESYSIRFTPRRARSIWSAVNIRRVEELTNAGLMRPAGLKAFAARQENKSTIYSYEQREAELPAQYAAELQAAPAAFEFFFSQPPSYRKAAVWWVVSAAKEETRRRRLATLIELSAGAARIPQFDVRKK